MNTASVHDPANRPRRSKYAKRTTVFGTVMEHYQRTYGPSIQDLVRTKHLTPSQAELVSRLSTNPATVLTASLERRRTTSHALGLAIATYLEQRASQAMEEQFIARIEERLLVALQQDQEDAEKQALALIFAKRMEEITHRPLLRLTFDVDDPNINLEQLATTWSKFDDNEPTGKSATNSYPR